MSAISRKSLTPLRSCYKTSSEETRVLAAWCMASQAFRSARPSSWKSFSRCGGKRAESNVRRLASGSKCFSTIAEKFKGGFMATMKVAQIPKGGADFEIVEREIPKPDVGHVRIKVQACGVCHSDVFTKEGSWPGIQYPRVPGHEVAGIIDELGAGVSVWEKGQRVGVGWHGGHDGTCLSCRRGGVC